MSRKPDQTDVENFDVPAERQTEIRSDIEKLKASGCLDDFRLLAAELGKEEDPSQTPGQVELMGDKAQVYRGGAGTLAEGFVALLNGADLFVRWKNRSLLEVIQLPKAGEYAILHVDKDIWESLPLLKEALKEDMKLAKQMKHDRQAHFKSFGKSAAAAT